MNDIPKYSVEEIDKLRRVVTERWTWGSTESTSNRVSRSYSEPERTLEVEQIVRTHMLAGHYAEDILESDRLTAQNAIIKHLKWKAEAAVREACAIHRT